MVVRVSSPRRVSVHPLSSERHCQPGPIAAHIVRPDPNFLILEYHLPLSQITRMYTRHSCNSSSSSSTVSSLPK